MIARGGMGEIFLAEYEGVAGFKKRCIIKKIRQDFLNEPTFVERFLNEGRTLVALTHSNIVQIFDMGSCNGEYYLAMEYIQGADLREMMRRNPSPIPVAIAIAVTREVLKGLSYAHRAVDEKGQLRGIVHRDISPSNILISSEGEVKIIDFGIAKVKTIESCSGIVQGKFAYMSPEQARGDHLDARTDLFSLGIVLYEMLTGVRPFDGNSDLQSLERIKCCEYRPLCEVCSGADVALEAIVNRALSKDLSSRFQSADEFDEALERYALSHRLVAGQRDVMLYFKPWVSQESVQDMDSALEMMINAQAMALQTTATRTLAPTQEDSVFQGEDTGKGALTPACAADATPCVVESEAAFGVKNSEMPSVEVVRRKNILMRLKYVLMGVFIALIAGFAMFLYTWDINSAERAVEVRTRLRQLHDGEDVQKTRVHKDENGEHPLSEGIPFEFTIDPAFAEVYVVEGVYRQTGETSFLLMPDREIEIAFSAPGYVTCLIHVSFDPSQDEIFKSYSSANCLELRPNAFFNPRRYEISAKLAKERVSEDGVRVEPEPVVSPSPKEDKEEKKKTKPRGSTHRERTTHEFAFLSNYHAELFEGNVADSGQGTSQGALPLRVNLASDTSFTVFPKTSGRTRGLPFHGKTGNEGGAIWVEFCEAKVRIQESYVSGDPAPWQLADIFFDGVRVAHEADSISIVAPCRKYEVTAKIQAGDVILSGMQEVVLTPEKTAHLALTLK